MNRNRGIGEHEDWYHRIAEFGKDHHIQFNYRVSQAIEGGNYVAGDGHNRVPSTRSYEIRLSTDISINHSFS